MKLTAVVQHMPKRVATPPKTKNDRYWVGNTGNWNDSSNWSYKSGGSNGYSPPTIENNVYFDENSGTASFTVTAEGERCNKFITTNLIQTMSFYHNGYGFFIYDDIALNPMTRMYTSQGSPTWQYLRLYGTGSHTITHNGAYLDRATIRIDTVGTYSLSDDLLMAPDKSFEGSLYCENGTFNTLGYTFMTRNFSNNGTTNFSSSSINVAERWNPGGGTLNTGTSHIYCDGVNMNWDGDGHDYYSVTFRPPQRFSSGVVRLNGSNTFVNLNFEHRDTTYLLPGYVELQAGTTQSISGTFSASGLPDKNLIIRCTDSNSLATLELNSDTVVNGSYLIISNSIATGSATWYAGSSSFDGGNNTGWIFEESP